MVSGYSYYNPVRINFGEGIARKIKEAVDGRKEILIVTDKVISSLPYFKEVMGELEGLNIEVYDNTSPNPSIENIVEAKEKIKGKGYDVVVGIGGGSSLDLAKVLLALRDVEIKSREEVIREIQEKSYLSLVKKEKAVFIAIPTTAGTGSEVTCWGTIWNKVDKVKYSIADELLYADCALVDPIFMSTMPKSLTIVTALDALCHATEAYWSKNTSEVVRNLSLRAISMLTEGIRRIESEEISMGIRNILAQGSTYAGLAFSNTKTTACHSISYPMTLMYGVEHGVAASITLGRILEMNLPEIKEKKDLLESFGAEGSSCVEVFVRESLLKAGYPVILREYGIPKEGIDKIVDGAYTKGRMDNNPVYPTREELYTILSSLY